MSQIIPVAGTPGIEVAENEMIIFKPLCEAIGIDESRQRVKLQEAEWAVTGVTPATGADGKTYQMFSLHKDSVPMWLATIQTSRLKNEQAKQTLIAYQKEAAKALNDYFTKGAAINEGLLSQLEIEKHKESALQLQCRAQVETLQAAKGLISDDHLEAKARIVVARSMHEAPVLDPLKTPLYVQDFLKDKNLSKTQMRRMGVFAKKVKARFIDERGFEPPKYPLTMGNGQVRNVLAYTEADRPLLESVFGEYFGSHLSLVA